MMDIIKSILIFQQLYFFKFLNYNKNLIKHHIIAVFDIFVKLLLKTFILSIYIG